MTFDYDDESDIMYLTLDEVASPCMFIESPSWVVLKVERETRRLIGVTIPHFQRRIEMGRLDIPELTAVGLSHGFLESLKKPA